MLTWEEAGTAVSDGHSPTCASHVPGPRSPETCMARAGCGGRACLLSSTFIPKIWTVVICTMSPLLRDTPERGYEKAELNPVKSKNRCTHWDLLDGGYALGLLFQGPWWPLNVQKLREAAHSSSAGAGYHHPTSRWWTTCMQELGALWAILSPPIPEEMIKIKSLQSSLCKVIMHMKYWTKRFLPHLWWRHKAGDLPKRKVINLPLWKSIRHSEQPRVLNKLGKLKIPYLME